MGKPDGATCARLAAKFEPLFPHADPLVNRELLALLVFLESPAAVAKGVPLLRVSEPAVRTPEEFGSAGLLARNDNYGRVVQKTSASPKVSQRGPMGRNPPQAGKPMVPPREPPRGEWK